MDNKEERAPQKQTQLGLHNLVAEIVQFSWQLIGQLGKKVFFQIWGEEGGSGCEINLKHIFNSIQIYELVTVI